LGIDRTALHERVISLWRIVMNATWRSLLGAIFALLLGAHTLAGQGFRAEVGVWGSFLELQGIVRDSLSEDQVPGDGLSRRLGDGTVVTCTPEEFCRWFRTEGEESSSGRGRARRSICSPAT
jgi:hypothetical protein